MEQLTDNQRLAVRALLDGRDVLVTAGAGGGKTRTLVACYLGLLERGCSPRQVVAITFTEKAAREMRSRVRAAVAAQLARANTPAERAHWAEIADAVGGARIGTIHALCAEIARAHPAEARVDPEFIVLDEGQAALLQAQVVADTIAWACGDPRLAPVFEAFTTAAVPRLLAALLARRLDAAAIFAAGAVERGQSLVHKLLAAYVRGPDVVTAIAELRALSHDSQLFEAGERLAAQIEALLSGWDELDAALAAGDQVAAARCLFALRRNHMSLSAGKRNSQAWLLLRDLRAAYDRDVAPWLNGRRGQYGEPDAGVERRWDEQVMPALRLLFQHVTAVYQDALARRQALDFDDLEAKAQALLALPTICQHWQASIAAVLIDEFQDTNGRQRAIVEALCGATPGRLFVVGDDRQSIYRFRGADVTIFRQMRAAIGSRAGVDVQLSRTFRAHAGLLRALDTLLSGVMVTADDPARPYLVPFTPLATERALPGGSIAQPFVEFDFGAAERAEEARHRAAEALASRLIALRAAGEIARWDDVALLFRAAAGFANYENALAAAGVPFVTIAGQGFYERPEVRDLLNMLRSLASPWDDLSLAGALRSPAFGLSDSALYRLRWQDGVAQRLRAALQGDLAMLGAPDQERARRARDILEELEPLVDRLPVAELLKRTIDRADYRSALATPDGRHWRNLDKLLADAHARGHVRVRAFLDHIQALRQIGARIGEPAPDTQDAVRLMTIHKAKGLEFAVVVLADAGRRSGHQGDTIYLAPEFGVAATPDRLGATPLATRIARWIDSQHAEAEEQRLLYVAATRAKEKLLISGHMARSGKDWRSDGWMQRLAEIAGVDLGAMAGQGGECTPMTLACGEPLGVWVAASKRSPELPVPNTAALPWPPSHDAPLYRPIAVPTSETAR